MRRDTIDLERTIYDPHYRREIITRLNEADAADEDRIAERVATLETTSKSS